MKYEKTLEDAKKDFEASMLPGLQEFVKIDNLSPDYDPEWETNGKAEKAGMHLINWAKAQGVKGLKAELIKEPGMTHMVFIEIDAQGIDKTVLLYGHFDKQPPLGVWDEGLHPNKPVIKDGLLYGRGASDDGYALFTIVESVKLIQLQNGKHGRIVITIESGEESGSPDLVPYLKKLKDRIGNPDLMICMDSGCKDYYSLWLTTSLRGVAAFEVEVECLKESVHSGTGSGVAPDSFTVLRLLLDRLDDPKTSKVVAPLNVEIPKYRIEDAEKLAEYEKEKTVTEAVKLLDGVKPLTEDYKEIILNNTWRPTVVVTGMSGFPVAETAGNVLRAKTKAKISVRLPPIFDCKESEKILSDILTKDPPYNSKVNVKIVASGNGWAAKDMHASLKKSFSESSKLLFGKDYYNCGEGGSIPFISELGELYPKCEILVTGVLGPGSNAHCLNECLNLDYTIKMIVALAHSIFDFSSQ
jgi:acetylornithine deacetylase/succinyl-diaminopimelate desuccinylase-like protein